ncbi:immune inhibitor A [Actinoplanes sp. KI2]|uniref:immune inhibitor A n=1 Tax=Actinoplanes sp. KI2 TaxID=2983315 RepID=UPI0021D589C4|nr:immune inhibitor A [Actinoplanes sp. KI2]MCU7728676.1 immune inhibitor A [Actinoplanes sp. KI2]
MATSLISVPASAAPHSARPGVASDVRELDRTHFTLGGKALPDHPRYRPHRRPQSREASAGTPPIGTQRKWLGLDDRTGRYYPKTYQLRAVGKHIEVWVADDLAFPKADCRKDPVEVTDPEIAELIHQFDDNIYPKETASFSTPPNRDGTDATMAGDYTGDGDKTVTLVDNVRDDNYYTFPTAQTYIAGFFSAQLNELFDRNVMTIDGYDWKHRLGADPADDPTDNLCTSRPAHPWLYESTFAHEWQHLLEYYADPDEVPWVNEGLSDFAQTLVGYVNGRAGVEDRGNDSHLVCFQGFGNVKTRYNPNPRSCGGPQNSLNLWNEGAADDVLADYGNAYEFMIYLRDRFGLGLISTLHRDSLRQGLAGVQAALPVGTALYDVLHDYQTMTLVDKIVGDGGGQMIGVPIDRVTAPSLRSTINLENPADYDWPGAAPNGADYVPLPTPLTSVQFTGAKTLPPLPMGWSVAGRTLFSGDEDSLDAQAVRRVTVPAAGAATLSLETSYAIEDGYDFGYVMVSTDGGKSYQMVAGDHTKTGPLGPGLTGTSGSDTAALITAKYDLSAYAGKKVLLGLRYVTDGSVSSGGWHINKITLGTRVVNNGTTLKGWRSPTMIVPTRVHAWHVSLVGIDGKRARLVPVDKFADLAGYPKVVAIVAYDEPTEQYRQYARYRLVVNGVLQPGGGTAIAPTATAPTATAPTATAATAPG